MGSKQSNTSACKDDNVKIYYFVIIIFSIYIHIYTVVAIIYYFFHFRFSDNHQIAGLASMGKAVESSQHRNAP